MKKEIQQLIEKMTQETKNYSKQISDFVKNIPESRETSIIGGQLNHSASSVFENFRSAKSSEDPHVFLNKMNVVIEESDQTVFWLELLQETDIIDAATVQKLIEIGEENYNLLSEISDYLKTDSNND